MGWGGGFWALAFSKICYKKAPDEGVRGSVLQGHFD